MANARVALEAQETGARLPRDLLERLQVGTSSAGGQMFSEDGAERVVVPAARGVPTGSRIAEADEVPVRDAR